MKKIEKDFERIIKELKCVLEGEDTRAGMAALETVWIETILIFYDRKDHQNIIEAIYERVSKTFLKLSTNDEIKDNLE